MNPVTSALRRILQVVLLAAVVVGISLPGSSAAGNSAPIPLPARLVLAKAGRLMEKKEYQQAVETLSAFQARGGAVTTASRSDPRGYYHPVIYFALGNGYLMLDNFSQAESAYRQALEGNPAYADCWMNLAVTCYRQEKYAEAGRCFVKSYETAAEKKPERLFYGAAAYLSGGQHERALAGFERLLAAHPAQVEPAWKETLIHAFLATGQPKRALPYIQELVQEHEGESKIRWQEILLQQYLSLDMPQEALKLAEELTREQPLAPRWWKALAHVHLTASRYEEALVAMTIYSWLTTPTEEEQRLLADLYLQLGVPVKAAPMYAAILRRRPDDHLLRNLVIAYRRLGRTEEALEHLEKFSQHVSDPSLLMLRGDLLYELGRYDDAADIYRQAAHTDRQQAGRAWLMAGYAAWHLNDLSGSRSAFERAAGFSDQKTAALAAIHRLAQLQP